MIDHSSSFDGLNNQQLTDRISRRLSRGGIPGGWGELPAEDRSKGSAVLFLITPHATDRNATREPCLLLNKRSEKVLQPGDLCCPGGGVGRFDSFFARFMRWPMSPLHKWPLWDRWRVDHPRTAAALANFLTTGFREGWEEMRLNPFRVMFLGCLPVQKLIMFERRIYPLVGWVGNHRNLKPNWEVERIVHIPLRLLMDPQNYGRYRLSFNTRQGVSHRQEKFPCYIHQGRNGREVLWGATFRMTMDFLKLVFGFEVPDLKRAPVIDSQLGQAYLSGSLIETGPNGHRERRDDF